MVTRLRTSQHTRRLGTPLTILLVVALFAWSLTTLVTSTFTVEAAPVSSTDSRVAILSGDHIAIVDIRTGQTAQNLPVRLITQSIFMAASSNSSRFFVTDAKWQNGHAVDYLSVYDTNTWRLTAEIPVPDIIRYIGDDHPTGIAPSTDGKYLYVYNYSDRDATSPVRYWLSILDLQTDQWVGQIDLPDCGPARILVSASSPLSVLCYDTEDIRVLNTQNNAVSAVSDVPMQVHNVGGSNQSRVGSGLAFGSQLYVVRDDQDVEHASVTSTGVGVWTHGVVAAQRSVGFKDIGVDPVTAQLLVPVGTPDENSRGLSSAILVADSHSGASVRTIRPKARFRDVAFSTDGSSAFVVGDQNGNGSGVSQINLTSGTERQVFTGPVSTLIVF